MVEEREGDQLEYMALEILFTYPALTLYPTCVLTNPNFWCRIFQVVQGGWRGKGWREVEEKEEQDGAERDIFIICGSYNYH